MAAEGSASEGLTLRVLGAWVGLRASTRWLLDNRPSEGTLLVFFMVGGLFHFLGRLATLWLEPAAAAMSQGELISRVAAELAGALIFRTLALYLLSGLGHLIARRCGGTGSGYESRAAMAWAALVAAPVALVATLAGLIAGPGIGLPAEALGQIGALAFALALAHAFAEAHGFERTWAVLAVIALMVFAILGALWALS